MGIKNFTKLIYPFYNPSKIPDFYDCILVDAQSCLYEAINFSIEPVYTREFLHDICKIVTKDLLVTLSRILDSSRPQKVLIVLSFDGEGVPMKWPTQRKRRDNASCNGKDRYRFALFGHNSVSKTVQSHLMESLKTCYEFADVRFVVSGSNVTGEGEHKLFDMAERFSCRHPIVVSVDHDVFMIAMSRLERYETVQIYRYRKFYNLTRFVRDVLPYPVRRWIVIGILFGNDFVPSLLEISSQNAAKIHTALTHLEDSYDPPEMMYRFLKEMSACMVYDRVPKVDDEMVSQFWLTYFWIADYYRFPSFPQKYLENSIFDSFHRNTLLTALTTLDYSRGAYSKAEMRYKNSYPPPPSVPSAEVVFNERMRRKLSTFWLKNESNEAGVCYEINVTKKR